MRALNAYQQQAPNWTRIEMLIAAFEGTLTRLKNASALLKQKEDIKAQLLLLRCQRLICELYAGINLDYGDIPKNMKSIYLFVLNRIGLGDKLEIEAAIHVLSTIHEALVAIRPQAIEMERNNAWGGVDREVRSVVGAIG